LPTSNPSLSIDKIRSAIPTHHNQKIDYLGVFESVDSTSDELWRHIAQGHTGAAICLSETQTAGRGRRGDHWHSPHSGNLYLSIFWPFSAETLQNGLSIAVGISLLNTLKSEGINNLQLKWPNDVLHKRKKIAGILVESRFGKRQNTVVGIGLNFKLPDDVKNQIQQPTTSLQQLCSELPCRNRLAGKIIHNMIETLERFQAHGLTDFLPQWHQYDALVDQEITLINGEQHIHAVACGINSDGALRYQIDNELHTLTNSHTSIRFTS
jgi:BirA family biotin operon repressor/biotin-[acetyl-CoA-carboxylase] ligase